MDSSNFPSQFHDPGRGTVFAYLGSMCSGKTHELLASLYRANFLLDALTMLFKYQGDSRTEDGSVKSRTGMRRQPDAQVTTGEEIWDIVYSKCKRSPGIKIFVAGIDEAHFIKGMRSFIVNALDHRMLLPGVTVLVYMSALDSTFEGKMWPDMCDWLPLCVYRKLTAVCGTCQQREAQLTRRDFESNELEVIGGEDKYTATCFVCHSSNPKK